MFKNLDKYQKKCCKKVGKIEKLKKKVGKSSKKVIISWKKIQ